MKTLLGISMLAVSAPLFAQGSTLPAGLLKTEGNSSHWTPFRYQNSRNQTLYSAKATGWTATKVINSLFLRGDSKRTAPAFKCDIMVELSSKGVDVKNAWANPNLNHGTDRKVFMKKKAYNIPALTGTTGPNAWVVELKGDAPFIAVARTLCVDQRTYAAKTQRNDTWYVDCQYKAGVSSGTRGKYVSYGTGCPTNFYNYNSGLNVGETFRQYGYSRAVGDVHVAWIGAGRTAVSIGGGCSIYTAAIVFHPQAVKTTSTSGYANFLWTPVPAALNGKKINCQQAAFDSKFKLKFSRGTEVTFGNYKTVYEQRVVYAYASGTTAYDPDKDNLRFTRSGTAVIHGVK